MCFFRFNFHYFSAIIHSISFLDAVVADFIWEDKASRCCEFTDGENGPRFFPIYQRYSLGQYFTGIAAETTAAHFPIKRRYFSGIMPLTPLFFRLHAVNAAIFPIQRRQRHYFCS